MARSKKLPSVLPMLPFEIAVDVLRALGYTKGLAQQTLRALIPPQETKP